MTPQDFGELIRTHREAKGLSIEELALRFKLSVQTVRGIESGDLDGMPHIVYAKGFVRAYAQAVDVSQEDLSAGLAVLFAEEDPLENSTVPEVVRRNPNARERRRSSLYWVFLLVLVLFGAGGWYAFTYPGTVQEWISHPLEFFMGTTETTQEDALDSPTRTVNAEPTASPGAEAASERTPEPSIPTPETQDAESLPPSSSVDALEDSTASSPSVPQAAEIPSVTADSASAPPISGKHIVISARESCWVEVAVDEGVARTFTVNPGETSIFPYRNKLTLVLGNTGGVSLIHNGKPYTLNGRRTEKRTLTFQ